MKTQFKVGDVIAYRASFLRSICDYSYESASKRFMVEEVVNIGSGMTILNVKTKGSGKLMGVNAKNVLLADEIHKEPN